jgi:hypothetical protein
MIILNVLRTDFKNESILLMNILSTIVVNCGLRQKLDEHAAV